MQIVHPLLLFILTSCASPRLDTTCKKCSLETPVMVIDKDNVSEQMVAKLFCTGTDSCLTNVEFMEVFNEALFVSLDKKPEVFIKQFSLSSNQEFIIKQLESPITDKIDIQKIIEKLASLPIKKTESYDKILQALNVAKKKAQ